MFAIIRTGGKQYKVSKDMKIVVEKIESSAGSEVIFTEVLMIGTDESTVVGSPLLKGAQVIAILDKQTRDDKVIIFKKKRRHNYRRKKGHKQHKTMLKIVDILQAGQSRSVVEKTPASPKVKTEAVAKAPAEKAKKAPAKAVKKED